MCTSSTPAPLSRTDSLFSRSNQWFMIPALLCAWILSSKMCACSHSHCGLICATGLTRPENTVFTAVMQHLCQLYPSGTFCCNDYVCAWKRSVTLMYYSGLNIQTCALCHLKTFNNSKSSTLALVCFMKSGEMVCRERSSFMEKLDFRLHNSPGSTRQSLYSS